MRVAAGHLTLRIGGVALTGLLAASPWLVAQQSTPAQVPPRFRAGTDVVRLEASVLDSARRPVRGLTRADFKVLEDGRERPIVAFTPVILPERPPDGGNAGWLRDAPLDVVSNATTHEGRLVVIVFDWSIRLYDQGLARRIAHAAIDNLGPTDLAAVLFTNESSASGIPQNFTADRALLHAAVDRPFTAAMVDMLSANKMALEDPEGYESPNCPCRLCSVEALTRVADALKGVSERPKVILHVTSYVRTFEEAPPVKPPPVIPGQFWRNFSTFPGTTCRVPLRDARRGLERAMGEANATIHVLDAVGMETSESAPLGGRRMQERQDALPVLADLTHGRTVTNTNAPETQVESILEETGSYYVLGFAPASTRADGRVHRIEVEVRRRDVTVKARDRYVQEEEPASMLSSTDGDLIRTLGSALPSTDVPLDVSVVPLVAEGKDATAAVVVARLVDPLPANASEVTFVSAAFTPRGASVTAKRRTILLGPPSQGAAARPRGLVSGLLIDPGRYEVRVAAELPSGAGSVHAFVEVPDFRDAPLSISGLLLRVEPDEPAAPQDEIEGMLPFVPTARRTFARTDRVSAFVQISQGSSRRDALAPVALRMRIIDARDRAVRDERLILAPSEFSKTRLTAPRLTLPVQSLPAGRYLLQLLASRGEREAARAVRFQVR